MKDLPPGFKEEVDKREFEYHVPELMICRETSSGIWCVDIEAGEAFGPYKTTNEAYQAWKDEWRGRDSNPE